MKGFLAWVLSYKRGNGDLLKEAAETLSQQNELLKQAVGTIDQWQQLTLASQRSSRDLAVAFRVYCESPEVDIRDELDQLVTELSDAVANFEEHLPR